MADIVLDWMDQEKITGSEGEKRRRREKVSRKRKHPFYRLLL